jgi:ESCRT-II complex subunit VPS36
LQIEQFNQESYFDKLAKTAKDQPGLTTDKMANLLKVNVVLMKELIKLAEEKGFLCRDESLEGIRYYENLFLKL